MTSLAPFGNPTPNYSLSLVLVIRLVDLDVHWGFGSNGWLEQLLIHMREWQLAEATAERTNWQCSCSTRRSTPIPWLKHQLSNHSLSNWQWRHYLSYILWMNQFGLCLACSDFRLRWLPIPTAPEGRGTLVEEWIAETPGRHPMKCRHELLCTSHLWSSSWNSLVVHQ